MPPVKKYGLFFLLIFNIGCISVNKELYNKKDPVQERRKAEKIEIVYDIPEKKHEIIGHIEIRFNKGYSRAYILNRIRSEASESGADGIIIKNVNSFNSSWKMTDNSGMSRSIKDEAVIIEALMYQYH